MLEVALGGGAPADGAGAGGVPDLGQVPEPDPRIMTPALVPVLAVPGIQVSIVTIQSGPGPGVRSRQLPCPSGGPSRLAGVKLNPAPSGGGPGSARFRWLLGSGRVLIGTHVDIEIQIH